MSTILPPNYRQLLGFATAVRERFASDRCTRVAAALSFTTVLALVPLTVAGIAMLSVFPVFQDWMERMQEFIYGNFVPAAGDAVRTYLRQFAANAGKLTAWGLLFVFVTALLLMGTIEHTFNDIWHVKQKRKRFYRFLTYWAILGLGPILIGVSLSLTSYLVSLPWFTEGAPLGGVRIALLYALPIVFEAAAFVLLYTVVPNYPVRWRHALIGGAVATVLFEIAKRGFAWFIAGFSSFQIIYGAIAALPVFLVWIHLSWTVILLGAVVTAQLPTWRTFAVQPASVDRKSKRRRSRR